MKKVMVLASTMILFLTSFVIYAQFEQPQRITQHTTQVSSTKFTYQGRLTVSDSIANGRYDFQFSLYDDLTTGAQIGQTITRTTTITDGLFTVQLDFGDVFSEGQRFLEVGVRPWDVVTPYTILSPRQEMTPFPSASSTLPISTTLHVTNPYTNQVALRIEQEKTDVIGSDLFLEVLNNHNYSNSRLEQTFDGGYVIATNRGSNLHLYKYDSLGELQWGKRVNEGVTVAAVDQTNDGGYVVFGNIEVANNQRVALIKYDLAGNIEWVRYTSSADEFVSDGHQTKDGGYIITGYSSNILNSETVIMKLDEDGIVDWLRQIGSGSAVTRGYVVEETEDEKYILAAYTNEFSPSSLLLLKYDHFGNLEWSKTAGPISNFRSPSLQITSDQGFIFTGSTLDYPQDVVLMRFSKYGGLIWITSAGGSNRDEGTSVWQTADGGFIVAGHTTSYGFGQEDILLLRYNQSGELMWSKVIGGTGYESATSIQQTDDGGYILLGETETFSSSLNTILIARLNSDGEIFNCAHCQTITPTIKPIMPTTGTPIPYQRNLPDASTLLTISQSNFTVDSTQLCSETVSIPTTYTNVSLEVSEKGIVLDDYLQLDTTNFPVSASDCNEESEAGRMMFNPELDVLYICSGLTGWITK